MRYIGKTWHLNRSELQRFLTKTKLRNACHMSTQVPKSSLEARVDAFKAFMIKDRFFSLSVPIVGKTLTIPLQLSNMAGHASFLCLAMSYMESDFLSLRTFAFSGISLSIIFQYYREKPLWIPIRWNSLFLLINGVMIMLILNEENSLSNLPEEAQTLFSDIFETRGMKPLEFRYLMSIAQRQVLAKHERIATQNEPIRNLYVVASGSLTASRDGESVASIAPNQFVGEMNFLKMEELFDQKRHKLRQANGGSDDDHNITQSSIGQLYNTINTNTTSATTSTEEEGIDFDSLLSTADVISDEESVVYSWSFSALHQLFLIRPALGVMLDRCISLDLSKKLSTRKTPPAAIMKYRDLLREIISHGHITEQNKALLRELQCKLKLSDAQHVSILHDLGWTFEDYALGYKGGPTMLIMTTYQSMLRDALKSNKITSYRKDSLRQYRIKHNIAYAKHLEILNGLGWTPDEYENGLKE